MTPARTTPAAPALAQGLDAVAAKADETRDELAAETVPGGVVAEPLRRPNGLDPWGLAGGQWQIDALDLLRQPFKPEQIGKLPRVTCRDCSDSQARVCSKHQKAKCAECDNFLTGAHIHLDYVGHAEVTDRLLSADPEWGWQPQATAPDPELLKAAIASGNPEVVAQVIDNAPPKFDLDSKSRPVGLWINLTVAGVTRPGYGSVLPNTFDAEKQLIGDALRNAAMRFGVALDLWSKGKLESEAELDTNGASRTVDRRPQAEKDQDGVDQRPWHEKAGYIDAEEVAEVNEPLREPLKAAAKGEHRAELTEWFEKAGYGAITLPVTKDDAPRLKRILDNYAKAAERPPDGPESAPPPQGTAQEPDLAGESQEPIESLTSQIPHVPVEVQEQIIRDTRGSKAATVDAGLKRFGLASIGNLDERRMRLAIAQMKEWGATHPKADEEPF